MALVVVAGLGACGGGSGDVVARVGPNVIARATFVHWLRIQGAANGQTASGQTAPGEALKQQALDFLISSQWTIGEAAELGVKATDAEAQRQLERFRYDQLEKLKYEGLPLQGRLQQLLSSPVATHADQLWLMKLALLIARVEQRRLAQAQRALVPAQIARYYSAHRRRFLVRESRDIEVILTYHKAVADKAKREIQAGKNFLSVAKRVSTDGEAPEGLQLGLTRGMEEPEYIAHIFAAKPHVLVGPIEQALGYYIFEVTNIHPGHELTPVQAEPQIRQLLAAREASTTLREAYERQWIARTSCRPGYVVRQCRQHPGATA